MVSSCHVSCYTNVNNKIVPLCTVLFYYQTCNTLVKFSNCNNLMKGWLDAPIQCRGLWVLISTSYDLQWNCPPPVILPLRATYLAHRHIFQHLLIHVWSSWCEDANSTLRRSQQHAHYNIFHSYCNLSITMMLSNSSQRLIRYPQAML